MATSEPLQVTGTLSIPTSWLPELRDDMQDILDMNLVDTRYVSHKYVTLTDRAGEDHDFLNIDYTR